MTDLPEADPPNASSRPEFDMPAHVRKVLRRLAKQYPDAHCALDYETPLQLLVATILSAQCTDERVNKVTPALFAAFPDAGALANAPLKEIETLVRSTGFYRNKAKNIQLCCRTLMEKYGGRVPKTMEKLHELAGVGRKTANVVLSDAFGVPGITVDTHVGRVSRRLGLTVHTDPVKVEFDLMAILPKRSWNRFNHRMIFHGRQVCHSQSPECDDCLMARICPKAGVTRKARPKR